MSHFASEASDCSRLNVATVQQRNFFLQYFTCFLCLQVWLKVHNSRDCPIPGRRDIGVRVPAAVRGGQEEQGLGQGGRGDGHPGRDAMRAKN